MEEANSKVWLDRIASIAGNAIQAPDPRSAVLGLHARHGDASRAFSQLVIGQASDRSKLYAAKNMDLALSLDASLSWSALLYGSELPLIEELVLGNRPGRVIDAGCEQGLITCFVAWLLPEADVVGIDSCKEAIDRARELADALGTTNARFEAGDVATTTEGDGDLVICSRLALGEAIAEDVDEPAELIAGERPGSPEWTRSAKRVADAIRAMTKEGGTVMSLERADSTALVRWARALADAGLDPLSRPPVTITVDEPGFPAQAFRVLIADRRDEDVPEPESRRLVRPRIGLPATGPWHGEDAEAVALGANLRKLVGAWRWTGSSGQEEHSEMHMLADGRAIELHCSTNGGRSTWIHEAVDVPDVIERLNRSLAALEGGPPASSRPILGGS